MGSLCGVLGQSDTSLSQYMYLYLHPGVQYTYKLTCVKVASYIFAASLLVVDSGNPSLLQALN